MIPAPAPAQPHVRALPDLPTAIGMAGTMRHAAAAGTLSLDTSVVIAIVAYSLGGR